MNKRPLPLDPEYLSEDDLATFFRRNNNHQVNTAGMEIGYSEQWDVYANLEVCNYEHGSFKVSIHTQEDTLRDFILGFQIKSRGDIDRLDYRHSWMRYLNQAAMIAYNPIDLQADICFRLFKSKTIIFSFDLHFYDEEYEHLTVPDEFIDYIGDNYSRLQEAGRNRHKLQR